MQCNNCNQGSLTQNIALTTNTCRFKNIGHGNRGAKKFSPIIANGHRWFRQYRISNPLELKMNYRERFQPFSTISSWSSLFCFIRAVKPKSSPEVNFETFWPRNLKISKWTRFVTANPCCRFLVQALSKTGSCVERCTQKKFSSLVFRKLIWSNWMKNFHYGF